MTVLRRLLGGARAWVGRLPHAGLVALALAANAPPAAAQAPGAPEPVPAEPGPAPEGGEGGAAADASGDAAPADTPAASPDGECRQGWEREAFATAAKSVVRVRTASGWGAGFAFEDPNTIVTALHVVEHARWVDVVARDGTVRRARVVHNGDQELDLAIIELETPFDTPLPVIAASPLEPAVGMPVLMIGHPGSATGGWSVSWGRVGSETRDNGAIEVDGTVNPGNSGGPLLDCSGRVLGVVSYLKGAGITMAIPIGELPRPGDRFFHAYRGAVATAVRLPNLVYAREAGIDYWGLGLGVDVVLKDRFTTALQGHYQWHASEPSGSVIDRSDRRWQIELLEEWRFFALGYIGLGLGAAVGTDYHRVLSGGIDVSDPAAPRLVIDDDRDPSTRIRPMATASWELSPLLLGYAYQLDVLRPEFSAHRITVGLRMESVLFYE